ncbi:aldehyde dehydrogenase family protein [Pseudogracilibacillus auburnensis]|uniref:Acetaldehyde dehydrogenase n=1 Tax=Pseudogracilibacillus auburnensis TaxID=1494959 RepID=A0A2V3VKY1_9BACI|nr:aldehyde dehydrogenase family protein [Pseudogracilibacillus auburnensis]MBO1001458.1 aldehyde dehydrogenase family protein [Pseudogracilibacillus auburnensis]PXW82447.1 acetaldehyde dehydrogenase [Pseudogracilibacillus auburnensis]
MSSATIYDKDLLALQEMRTAVRKAKEAQAIYQTFTQEQVDEIVKHVAEKAYQSSERLAKMAVKETKMGVVEHKIIKNQVGSKDVYESIKDLKTVGVVREDRANKLLEIADPFGVVLAIIPTTNPTSTAYFKTLIALKTRNAIVVSPHPYAVQCTKAALEVCKEAAEEAGAPADLLQILTYSSMEATSQAMKHPNIQLILATGGGGLVKAAYSSGKPAYGVGPGNVPVYVEKSAKLDVSIKHIIDSKSFDNGTICATEQAIIVDKTIKDKFIAKLERQGGYILNNDEKKKMECLISPQPGRVNPAIVGKSASFIAKEAGITLPENTRVIIGLEDKVGKNFPFSLEKLAPIFALYVAEDLVDAKRICTQLLNLGGRGHSLSIHTENDQIARTFAVEMPVSRILVNTMSSIGAVGGTTGLKPSMTLGCGSYGGNITSDNISAEHLINIKRIAYGNKSVDLPKQVTTYQDLFDDDEIRETLNAHISNELDQALIQSVVEKVIKKMS